MKIFPRSMQRVWSGILTLAVLLPSLLMGTIFPSTTYAAPVNAYIKGSASTVYWYSSNGKRYVLPNSRTFQSWIGTNIPSVTTISDVELYTLPIGGNVTYRPGSRLVKITTDPRVYAVSRYGVLRWVTSESVARSLYGDNWNQTVDDLPDEYFSNYTMGTAIYSSGDYSPSTEYYAVSTPNDNISTQASVGGSNNNPTNPVYSSIELTSDRSSLSNSDSNREIRLTATVRNASIPTDRVRIQIYEYNENQTYPGNLLLSCTGYLSCGVTTNLPNYQTNYTRRYMAIAQDTLNSQAVTTNYYLYIPVYGTGTVNASGNVSLSVDRSSINAGDNNRTANFTATVSSNGLPTERVRIQIVNDNANQVERTCNGTLTCTLSYTVPTNTNYSNLAYRAEFRDRENNNLIATSQRTSVTISGTIIDPAFNAFLSNTNVVTEMIDHSLEGIYDRARIRVRLVNPPTLSSGIQINLYRNNNEAVGYAAGTVACNGQTECIFTFGSDQIATHSFYARAQDAYGNVRQSNSITINFNPTSLSNNHFTSATRIEDTIANRAQNSNGETVQYRAQLINGPSNLNGVTLRIYERTSNNQDIILTTCNAVRECSISLTSSSPVSKQLFSQAWDSYGNAIASPLLNITYGNQSQPLFQVTNVAITHSGTVDSCNQSTRATGTITTNGAGTVNYQWERNDGSVTPLQTLTFSSAGSINIQQDWSLSNAGWMRLKVLSPNNLSSAQLNFNGGCNVTPPPPSTPTFSGMLYTSADPGIARRNDILRVDAELTLNQTSGQVRVDIYNQDQQRLTTCWMTTSGFCHYYNARIPTNASGNYYFYAKASDSAGNTISSNMFPVRIMP